MRIIHDIMRAFSNVQVIRTPAGAWELSVWCRENEEQLYKVMGKLPCSQAEQEELEIFLFKHQKYELLSAMLYCGVSTLSIEYKEKIWDLGAKQDDADRTHKELVLLGQIGMFLSWCDDTDIEKLRMLESAVDLYRMMYLSFFLGYKRLGFWFMSMMSEQTAGEGQQYLAAHPHTNLLFRKWIQDFYQRQPKGKSKKRLLKRMVQHGGYRKHTLQSS